MSAERAQCGIKPGDTHIPVTKPLPHVECYAVTTGFRQGLVGIADEKLPREQRPKQVMSISDEICQLRRGLPEGAEKNITCLYLLNLADKKAEEMIAYLEAGLTMDDILAEVDRLPVNLRNMTLEIVEFSINGNSSANQM